MTARAERRQLRRMPLPLAFAIAVAIEVTILGIVTGRPQKPAEPAARPTVVMQVNHVDLPEPAPLPAPAPVSAPPKVVAPKPAPPKPARVPVVPRAEPAAAAAMAEAAAAPPQPVEGVAAPTAIREPAAQAAATATPAQQQEAVRFETLLRAAVQAAAKFPAAAKAMGRQGRVRVGFDFEDGRVSAIHIVESGSFPPFDTAAAAAVEEADYPPAPAHLRHQTLHLTVWIEFLKKGY